MSAAIVKEISSVKKFVLTRDVGLGPCDPTLLSNFARAIIAMINTAPTFGAAEASSVQEALADPPYGDATASIYTAIDRRVGTATVATHAGGSKRKAKGEAQLLIHFWNYCITTDWGCLKDKRKSFSAKMTCVVERFNSLGLINPDEQTYKWALAVLLLLHYEELPSYKEIHSKLLDLKQCSSSERKDLGLEHVVEFPEHPRDLPPSLFRHAYPNDDEQPLQVTLSGVKTVADHIPLRSNSKLLKGPKAKPPADVDCSVPAIASPSQAHVLKHEQLSSVKAEPTLAGEAPSDPDAKLLWFEYQAKLNELQAKKLRQTASSPASPSPVSEAVAPTPSLRDAITITRNTEGKLLLRTRSQPASAMKAEDTKLRIVGKRPPAATVEAPIAAVAAATAPSLQDLDPYTRQAIAALSKRNVDDKAEKAAAKANERAAAKEAANAAVKEAESRTAAAKKQGRASAKKEKAAVKTEHKTEKPPTAKATTRNTRGQAEEVPKAKVLQARPKLPTDGSNPAPIYYNGGAIYTSRKIKRFRALGRRGDNYSETSAGWGPWSLGSEAKAWAVAVESINKYQKKMVKKK